MSDTLRQGARVLLRHPREEDEEEFIALARSSRRFHAGWVAPPFSPSSSRPICGAAARIISNRCSSRGAMTTLSSARST